MCVYTNTTTTTTTTRISIPVSRHCYVRVGPVFRARKRERRATFDLLIYTPRELICIYTVLEISRRMIAACVCEDDGNNKEVFVCER